MRTWTDGERSAFHVGSTLTWIDPDGLKVFEEMPQTVSYGPYGALTVHPEEDVVWLGDDGESLVRLDITTGEQHAFDFCVADLAYYDEALWAVTGGKDRERRFVKFEDSTEPALEELSLPALTPVAWPYGSAYQFAHAHFSEPLGPYSKFRVTATEHGVCLASDAGRIWGIRGDQWCGLEVPAVYQGWLAAEFTEYGWLVTAVHNGRTGEVVRLDKGGCWFDAYDSNWNSLTPAREIEGGLMVGHGSDEIVVLEGLPSTISRSVTIGAWPNDLAASADGKVASWVGESSYGLCRFEDGRWMNYQGTESSDPFQTLGEPESNEPWCWTRTQISVEPPISMARPDPVRMAGLLKSVDEADFERLREELKWFAPDVVQLEKAPHEAIFKRLMRDSFPARPSRDYVLALARRAFEELDDFERYHLGAVFPGPGGGSDADNLDGWVAVNLRSLDDSVSMDSQSLRVKSARLEGQIEKEQATWKVYLELEDGRALTMKSMAIPGSVAGEHGDDWVHASGTFGAEPLGRAGFGVEPYFDFAHRLSGESRDLGMWFETVVHVLPTRIAAESIDKAHELLSRHVDVEGWFIGEVDDGFAASTFAEDFEAPVPAELRYGGQTATRLVRRLVDAKILELDGDLDASELHAIERIIYAGNALGPRAERLEDALFEMDTVDDLFGELSAIEKIVDEFVSAS